MKPIAQIAAVLALAAITFAGLSAVGDTGSEPSVEAPPVRMTALPVRHYRVDAPEPDEPNVKLDRSELRRYSETINFNIPAATPKPKYGFAQTQRRTDFEYADYIEVSATAYTTERQTNKITATGSTARVGVIAVDPRVIPYGTKMYIEAADGSWVYGYATAEDCGGGIKGNKIDLFFDTHDECIQFGVRKAVVYIIPD